MAAVACKFMQDRHADQYFAAARLTILGFPGQPPTPLNRPGKEHQKFEIFSKCLEKSENL
jgi:hypothetical protein